MAGRPGFQVVDDEIEEPAKPENAAAIAMLTLALKALSQRMVIALADLFCLFTAASVFWLWFVLPEDPSVQRIVALSIYAGFIVVLNMIVRRRK